MNYSEVIKHFKSLQKRYTTEHNGKMCEKVQLALEALEKQMPKKPKLYEWDKEKHKYTECCPTCGDIWNLNEFGEGMKYCWECGQAILWEE